MNNPLPVRCAIWDDGDYYRGTREALIAAGVAKPEYFANVGSRFALGKRRRSFYGLEDGRVCLRERVDGTFGLAIKCSKEDEFNRRKEQLIFRCYEADPHFSGTAPAAPARQAAKADRSFQRFLRRVLKPAGFF